MVPFKTMIIIMIICFKLANFILFQTTLYQRFKRPTLNFRTTIKISLLEERKLNTNQRVLIMDLIQQIGYFILILSTIAIT